MIPVHLHIGAIEIRLQKRYSTKKKNPHKRGLSSVGGISMFMMWICMESLVIILRFISIRVTILQVITLHDHNSTGALFCRDPYSCLPRENVIIFIHVSFGKKTTFSCPRHDPLTLTNVCIYNVMMHNLAPKKSISWYVLKYVLSRRYNLQKIRSNKQLSLSNNFF